MSQEKSSLPDEKRDGRPVDWRLVFRIIFKAAALFLLLNLLFAILWPMETLGSISLYNSVLPGRLRLPYGENAAESYNLSLDNIPAMMSSHVISQPKADDEFRIIIIGDSGTWGWLLENEDSLAGQINAGDYRSEDGRRIVAYNLGYPIMALTKDLLLLDEAMNYFPDLILWPVTLQSFPRDKQLIPPLVQNNAARVRSLISSYDLDLNPEDELLVDPSLPDRTVVGQRRALADLLRLQTYGFSWAATGLDQAVPEEISLRSVDLEPDISWLEIQEKQPLDEELLAIEVLDAGLALAGEVPVLIVNEPVFISDGANSDLRYNAWYPRWALDEYRALLQENAQDRDWPYLDLWDSIPASEFTDSPVHLTPEGTRQLAEMLIEEIQKQGN